jgi:mannose-1-phosphate guanylyltransferase / mannose-6-phosphate isomerase
MKIYPLILSGGSGTRLWPLSRSSKPKQFHPLVSGYTMVQETVLRLAQWPDLAAPTFVCGNDHRFMIAEQMREIGVTPLSILLESTARNTAPAVAAAAHFLLGKDPDAIIVVLPADHVINDVDAFRDATMRAVEAAQSGALATFGIVPTLPETGYGYIRRGVALNNGAGVFKVDRFVEKPDRATAERFLAEGDYFWNSGMFVFRADRYLEELRQFVPAMASNAEAAVRDAYSDLDFCRLEEKAFAACPSDSIDYAVMERTAHAVVVPADIGWSDVGSWSALSDVLDSDESGNVVRGDVYLDQVENSLVRSESRFVAAVGVKDVVIIETKDAVLVAHKDEVQRIKHVVDFLKKEGRTEHQNHTQIYRPWGSYEGIDLGERYQVKRITVKPGEKLSLQMHHHRAEHWVVVSGTATVTCGDTVKLLTENESVYIPIGVTHRLENPGKLPLHLIEVQSGSYLGEDDIVRFEDIYSRS